MRNGNGKTRRTRNSKDKHVRDTNNYRAVAHTLVNAVCVYKFFNGKHKSCDVGEWPVNWLEMNYCLKISMYLVAVSP